MIREQNLKGTAFGAPEGHYECLGMPFFGLTNAHAVFINLMHQVFREFLDELIIVFIDDILVYSKNKEEHKEYLGIVLQTLKNQQLFAKLLK